VLAQARALLDSHESGATEYIDADLCDTDTILSSAQQLLDFTQPVAITLISILHAIPDAACDHSSLCLPSASSSQSSSRASASCHDGLRRLARVPWTPKAHTAECPFRCNPDSPCWIL
jgi:hypothetical protein